MKETKPESNRYLDLPDTLHILSHSIQQGCCRRRVNIQHSYQLQRHHSGGNNHDDDGDDDSVYCEVKNDDYDGVHDVFMKL